MSDWPPTLAVTYLIYCLVFYTLTLGGCGYAVFVLGHSGWWFLPAVYLISIGYKPHRWYELYTGINTRPDLG